MQAQPPATALSFSSTRKYGRLSNNDLRAAPMLRPKVRLSRSTSARTRAEEAGLASLVTPGSASPERDYCIAVSGRRPDCARNLQPLPETDPSRKEHVDVA